MLASLVLPAQILDYFLISGVEQTSQDRQRDRTARKRVHHL